MEKARRGRVIFLLKCLLFTATIIVVANNKHKLKGESMKRVIYLPDELNENKHVLKKVYEGHGVYRRYTPSGFPVSQEWAIVRESDGFTIVTESYNILDYEDMLDAIDNYKETGKYGLTCLQTYKGKAYGYYNVHRGGNLKL